MMRFLRYLLRLFRPAPNVHPRRPGFMVTRVQGEEQAWLKKARRK